MPRGGKRPGSGARKGNFNALKGGGNSARFMLVYFTLVEYPDKRALALLLRDAGFIEPGRAFRRRDLPAVFDFLWRHWFDRSPENDQRTVKAPRDPAPAVPAPESAGAPEANP